MSDSSQASSQLILKRYSLGGIALILVFIALFAGVFVYVGIMGNGGVDIFIVAAPLCFFSYQFVLSIYVGVFMSVFSSSVGKSSWLWGFIGLAITAGFMYGTDLFAPPPLSILVPILSTLITLALIKITSKSTMQFFL